MLTWDQTRTVIDYFVDPMAPDGWIVDAATHAAAMDLCHRLQAANVVAPRVFSHGGDAVVLEWDNRIYLTIGDEDASIYIYPEAPAHARYFKLPDGAEEMAQHLPTETQP